MRFLLTLSNGGIGYGRNRNSRADGLRRLHGLHGNAPSVERVVRGLSWGALIWACVFVAFVCFLLGLFGCTPGANFAAYGSAFNGQFNQPYGYPAPAYYYAPPYQSQWMGPPRVTCNQLGQFYCCREI